MANHPRDRFDDLPKDLARVGAHRAPPPRGRGWIGLAWSILAIGVLIFAGLYGLSKFVGIDVGLPIFDAAPTPTATPTPTPTATPILDPAAIDPARNIRVAVLNGTPKAELQNAVGDALATAGWVIDSRALASQTNVEKTTVYYSDPANEDVARGLVVSLAAGMIKLVSADTFPGTPATVVIGLDYPGAARVG